MHSLNEGGIERLLLELCRKIDKEKFEIQICILYERGIISDEFISEGVRLHFVNAKREMTAVNVFHNISAIKRIIKIIRKEKTDITHGHEFYSTVFSRISGLLSGIRKRYITLHNVYYWWSPGVHKMQLLLSYITTGIICNSKATLEYSLKHDKIKKNKYRLIYNGIDCEKFKPGKRNYDILKNQFGINPGKKIILTVGSISHRKAFDILIKAFTNLVKYRDDLKMIIAGDMHFNEENYYDEIKNLISESGLNEDIILAGNRKDVDVILNSCDIFVMPSRAEGFGLALAEAMASENVCIASDIAPFKEIIDDKVNGFLFESGNPVSLENKISEVLNLNEDHLKMIGKYARIKIKNNFNTERMIGEYEKLYSEK